MGFILVLSIHGPTRTEGRRGLKLGFEIFPLCHKLTSQLLASLRSWLTVFLHVYGPGPDGGAGRGGTLKV